VSGFVDTNVLIRHLAGGPPAMSKRATAFLREASELYLTDLVVAETIYVLESYYEVPREQIATTIRSLLAFDSISVVDRDVLLRAVEVYEIDRLDFAEAYLVACAESTGIGRVVSFDRSIDRVSSIERVER
jgi:predicted nucleic-acid-binding protein